MDVLYFTGKGNPSKQLVFFLPSEMMGVVVGSLLMKLTLFFFFFAVGGLVYGNSFGQGLQYHEWTSFISDNEFCFRACVGARATSLCNHIYDVMGCYWVRFSNPSPVLPF